MNREEIKNTIDFNKIGILTIELIKGLPETTENLDYLMDSNGNHIFPLSPLDVKLIEKIKNLEERIKTLEEK